MHKKDIWGKNKSQVPREESHAINLLLLGFTKLSRILPHRLSRKLTWTAVHRRTRSICGSNECEKKSNEKKNHQGF